MVPPDYSLVAQQLSHLGVGFYCTHPHYAGEVTVALPAADLAEYARDPVLYLAKHYGLSRSQYLAWHESNYSVTCASTTRSGKPCRNIVEGGHSVEPARWRELQGTHCHRHS